MAAFLPVAILLCLSMSCSGPKVFEEYHKFDHQSWNRFDLIKFEFTKAELNREYDLYVVLRHLPEFALKELPVNISLLMPSGAVRSRDYKLRFFDNEGNRLSECLGDYCDISILLMNGVTFSEPGSIQIEIENKFTKIELPSVLEVGLIINKAE
jgi:gliding motility-associated lipoprotein GldH